MIKKQNTKIVLLSLVLCALLIRIFALFSVESIFHPVTWEYEEIANNFLAGKGLCFDLLFTKYRSTAIVLYSLICALIYRLANHSFLVLKIFQIFLSLFNCIVIYKIAERLFGIKIGLIALALISFHPGLIFYSVRLHPLTLDALLFSLSAYRLLLTMQGKNVFKNSFLTGLLFGLTLLTRTTIGLFIPIALFFIYLNTKKHSKKAVAAVLCFLFGISLILLPLLIRNYMVFRKLVVLPNESGYHFWIGNSSVSVGTACTSTGESVFTSAPVNVKEMVKNLNEFQQKEFFYRETWEFIKNNPKKSISLFIKKLFYFWWFTPTQGLRYPNFWSVIYKLFYFVYISCAIIGICIGIRMLPKEKRQAAYMIILFSVTISLAQAIYYVEGRHRWAIEPFILIFSACGINLIYNKLIFRKGLC